MNNANQKNYVENSLAKINKVMKNSNKKYLLNEGKLSATEYQRFLNELKEHSDPTVTKLLQLVSSKDIKGIPR